MALPEVTMPAGILPFSAADHVITPEPLYVQVDRQAGHTRSRRRFRSVPTMVNTSFEATEEQLEAFFDWHENALIAGSLPFAANIAKIGPGTECWKAFIVRYTVDHNEGSHSTVKVELRLVGDPSDNGPTGGALSAEFTAALVALAGVNTGSALTVEFSAALETDVDLGPLLSAEFFGRLYTQVGDGPADVSMDAEFFAELQTTVSLEPGANFSAEFLCALETGTFTDTDLVAEISAALLASITSIGFVPSPAGVSQYAYQSFYPSGYSLSGIFIGSNGEIRTVANNEGSVLAGNWWSPTQPGVGTGLWVRMTHLTGNPFNERVGITTELVGGWVSLSTTRFWYLVRYSSGTSALTAQVDIATDPDGNNVVSSFNVALTTEYGP